MNSLENFVKYKPATNNTTITITNTSILTDLESKATKLTNTLSESLYGVVNEPSLGFYRIQVKLLLIVML
jgi:hypothetical protein